jgi:hypothetical protein
LVQERTGNTLEVIGIGKEYLIEPSSSTIKRKYRQMGLNKTKKLLHDEINGL